jgi:ribose transport system ATP-binding protein
VALGQQFVLLSGGFDISVGSTISLTVVLASLTLPDLSVESLVVTVPLLLLAAAAVGGFNAVMIGALKVGPIVATIATLGIVQGIAILLRPEPGGFIAPQLLSAVSLGFGFVPAPFAAVVLVAIALEVWLYRSRGGLALRGVGFNPEASRRIGRRVGVIRSGGLLICAFGAVVAGLFLAAQVGVGSNAVGSTYSLPCFAAVFLGGAALSGGRGSFIGALLGAVFLSLIDNVTPLLNIPDATRQLLYGAILLIAVTAYAIVQRRQGRSGRA